MTLPVFKIGGYEIRGGILAPMAGYTDIAFRSLCSEFGAGLTVTEMVSVRGLVHGNAATKTLMRLAEAESPSCVQIFGNDPDDFARAAPLINCDIIDINMGCPMPKITGNGDGAALMKDPELAGKIVAAIKNATNKPVTVKTRLGYKMGEPTAAELVDSVVRAGAAAVAIHGRFAEQRYSGKSDTAEIKRIAENSSVPIILNGDLESVYVGSPFAAAMIGRAALRDPALFSGDTVRSDPFDTAERHLDLLSKYFDERYTVFQARKFFVHYFKGVHGGKALRDAVNSATNVRQVRNALDIARAAMYNN